ncbi:hypothetical protein SKAU_G00096410 [Synaphobranchus kaupii]|uniref:Uncharacterized protein n=1 Tax=Synaphobranchus kaupii TaxID=118154 RepID=A0A9Q1FYJ4_SYNKA|nr:hypothetical protein SKAU_G00096410 [Synaphobranchus kaupii]
MADVESQRTVHLLSCDQDCDHNRDRDHDRQRFSPTLLNGGGRSTASVEKHIVLIYYYLSRFVFESCTTDRLSRSEQSARKQGKDDGPLLFFHRGASVVELGKTLNPKIRGVRSGYAWGMHPLPCEKSSKT